jgi:hypothetical protein
MKSRLCRLVAGVSLVFGSVIAEASSAPIVVWPRPIQFGTVAVKGITRVGPIGPSWHRCYWD